MLQFRPVLKFVVLLRIKRFLTFKYPAKECIVNPLPNGEFRTSQN